MRISCFTGGMVATNGYLIETGDGNFLVDAPEGICAWVREKGVRVDAVYLTHQHYDHVEDIRLLQENRVRVFAWAQYSKELTLEAYAAHVPMVKPYLVDNLLRIGEQSLFGGKATRVCHVPGHSPDSLIFYIQETEVVFAGDALFAGSVGRCDLPGGSLELLLEGIRREILVLPDETRVLAGHGPETTVGVERDGNGYLM
ncbi:MAG: MBL fold metallo-hydrolase [Armatimonadetes bacterium]|nr:MBL fold metallo-hydrolase [Akkermansiaceae bacterium]